MGQGVDARVTAVRDDLAAASLKHRFARPRYAEGVARRCAAPSLPLAFAPARDARLESELLLGEPFTVYDQADGWAWGQAGLDGYVGYVPAAGLAAPAAAPDHVVAVAASHRYPAPDLKTRPLDRLGLGARVTAGRQENGFVAVEGGWLYARHLAPLDRPEPDFVATARKLVGVPYLWGGRSAAGLDCSALVQLGLQRAGLACPRDSDMQAQALGEPVAPVPEAWRRGDLVYFPGHVVIVADDARCLHANAHWMAVVEEPLADVLARAEALRSGVGAVRRVRPAQ